MTAEEYIGLIVGIIGCFVALWGGLRTRDAKISTDGRWQGAVDTQLKQILSNTSGITTRVDGLCEKVNEQGERITAVEESSKQAHKRIDRLEKDVD